jgi:hypothetical protein
VEEERRLNVAKILFKLIAWIIDHVIGDRMVSTLDEGWLYKSQWWCFEESYNEQHGTVSVRCGPVRVTTFDSWHFSGDDATHYHMTIKGWGKVHSMLTRFAWYRRLYFAYRHSFRSGFGAKYFFRLLVCL